MKKSYQTQSSSNTDVNVEELPVSEIDVKELPISKIAEIIWSDKDGRQFYLEDNGRGVYTLTPKPDKGGQ